MVQILSRTSQITQIGKADSLKMSCLQVRLLYLVFTLSRMICRDYSLCKVQSQTPMSRREALRRTGRSVKPHINYGPVAKLAVRYEPKIRWVIPCGFESHQSRSNREMSESLTVGRKNPR